MDTKRLYVTYEMIFFFTDFYMYLVSELLESYTITACIPTFQYNKTDSG